MSGISKKFNPANDLYDQPLAYRGTIAPFGTYTNPDGSESAGFAWPGMITEPLNALQRLHENSYTEDGRLGIPNPQYQGNKDDALTALLSIYAGNALNPATRLPENALGMFAGRNAKTANLKALSRAEDMAGKGASREDIWNDTGWFQGADDKWRFEIDDSEAAMKWRKQGLLSKVLKHDDLYAAYPSIGDIKTRREAGLAGLSGAGGYKPQGEGWFSRFFSPASIHYSAYADRPRKTLLHEAQHALQQKEPLRGYRGASNPGNIARDDASVFWGTSSPDVASTYARGFWDNDVPGSVAPAEFNFSNPMTLDANGRSWANLPFDGASNADELAIMAREQGHDGLIIQNVMDAKSKHHGESALPPANTYVALQRGTVRSPLTGETLFSDTGRPSIAGSAIAAENANAVKAWHSTPAKFDTNALNPMRGGAAKVAVEEAPQGLSMHGYRGVAAPDFLIPDKKMQPARSSGAFWGTSSPKIADSYASLDGKMDVQTAPSIAPVDFNFSNPLVVDADGHSWANVPFGGRYVTTDVLARAARMRGHDGMVVKNVLDDSGYFWGDSSEISNTIAALRPGTVRSATTGETLFSDTGRPSIAGSAIAAENANAVKAWHSTPAKFDTFDNAYTDEVGFHFGSKNQAHNRAYVESGGNPWTYFTKWRDIPVEMDVKNPANISRDVGQFNGENVARQLVKDSIAPIDLLANVMNQPEAARNAAVRNWLVENGYDAVKYPNRFEGVGDPSYMMLNTGNVRHARTGDTLYSDTGRPSIAGATAASADQDEISLDEFLRRYGVTY